MAYRSCPRMHPCKLFCHQSCAQCRIVEERHLPCGHTKKLRCHVDEFTYKCEEMLEDVMPLCNHKVMRQCWQNVEEVECQERCEWQLPDCGHACPMTCHKKRDPDHLDVSTTDILLNSRMCLMWMYGFDLRSSNASASARRRIKIAPEIIYARNCVLKRAVCALSKR